MKIAFVTSNLELRDQLARLVTQHFVDDQFVLLAREHEELHLNRVDLSSTGIVIVDSVKPDLIALETISQCTEDSCTPAFIYLCKDYEMEDLEAMMRAGVSTVIRQPIEPNELIEAIKRIKHRRYLGTMNRSRGKVLAFISCKGGAGATFISTNLAYVLAERFEKKVLFIDLNMQGGDASFYVLNTLHTETLGDIARQAGLESTTIASAAIQVTDRFYLLQSPESPDQAAGITAQHIDNLISVAIQDYDFVILDIPHVLDAVSMKALDRTDLIFPVTQPMVNYLRSMVKQLRVFSMLGYPSSHVQVVLSRMDPNINLSLEKMSETIDQPIAWVIPNDFKHAIESVNLGISIAKLAHNSSVTEALNRMGESLCGTIGKLESESIVSKLMNWMR
jgi:pilus assembly protein CpaE